MGKEVVFKIDETTFIATLVKVDREKLYGWVEYHYEDSLGNELKWANLLSDGITIVGNGGTALKYINLNGNEISKSTLVAHNLDGTPAQLQKSVFEGVVILNSEFSIDDLFRLDVKSVYQLDIIDGIQSIKSIFEKYSVLYFQFNYRADYQADDAFMIAQNGNIFIISGLLQEFEYAYSNKSIEMNDSLDDEFSDNAIDFSMF